MFNPGYCHDIMVAMLRGLRQPFCGTYCPSCINPEQSKFFTRFQAFESGDQRFLGRVTVATIFVRCLSLSIVMAYSCTLSFSSVIGLPQRVKLLKDIPLIGALPYANCRILFEELIKDGPSKLTESPA